MTEIREPIATAADFLRSGEVVAIPTETVYGLAGNALNPTAVTKIFAVKNRPTFNPLIIHTDTFRKIRPYVGSIPEVAHRLANQFWPGPLTMLFPKTSRIPDIVTAGLDRVAVRIPQHPLTQQLLATLDFPLAAPSANPSGYVSPTTAAHVAEQLGDKIAYILDGGACTVGIESTIVGFEAGNVVVYRWGGISQDQLQQVVGKKAVVAHSSGVARSPQAPGMLKSHYAPQRQVVVGNVSDLLTRYPSEKVAIMSFQVRYPQVARSRQVVLSASGSLAEAAQRLFAALRYLDTLPVVYILVELVPDEGLGRAINDRLMRAAAQS